MLVSMALDFGRDAASPFWVSSWIWFGSLLQLNSSFYNSISNLDLNLFIATCIAFLKRRRRLNFKV